MLPANCSESIFILWSELRIRAKIGLMNVSHLMKGSSLAPFPSTAQEMTHTPFLSLTTAPSIPWKYKMKWIADIELKPLAIKLPTGPHEMRAWTIGFRSTSNPAFWFTMISSRATKEYRATWGRLRVRRVSKSWPKSDQVKESTAFGFGRSCQ